MTSLGAVRAAYYAFILSIPLETIIYVQRDEQRASAGGFSISRLIGYVLFGLAVANWKRCFRYAPPAFWLVAWYLGFYTLSWLWIPYQLDGKFLAQQLTLIQMMALFLISVNLFREPGFRTNALRLYGWTIAFTAALIVLGGYGADLGVEDRRTILQQNPNATAALFAFGGLCLASDPRLLQSGRRLLPALASLSAVGVLVAGILQTGSRGGLLGFGAGLLGLAACGGKTTRGARAVLFLCIAAVLALLVRREFQNETAMAERLTRSWTGGDTAGRTEVYDAAWNMFLERPIIGYGGANNTFLLGTQLNKADFEGSMASRDTHNVFLAVLTEVGLVGGGPFIAALLLALLLGWRAGKRTGDALPFALMCTLLAVNTSGTGYKQKIFWIVLAAAVAAGSARRARA